MSSIFDMGSVQATGLQSAASAVATGLVPKRHAAADASSIIGSASPTAKAAAAPTTTTSTATADQGQISSNDFLTLLVSELKNQDPSQPTDPNAYISQLVGVNSLQQLISINQGITSLDPTTTPTTPTPPAG